MTRSFCLLLILFFCISNLQAQSYLIHGRIVNEKNTPQQGIDLILRHGGRTVTAVNGSFSLTVTVATDTLDVAAAGFYPLSLPVNNQTILPLLLSLRPLSKNLEEVVIHTGYQKISKERATGSFTTISNASLNEQTSTNLLERLEAITNGLYFDRQTAGAGPKIVIRGLSTIQGPRSPLIILDDFPFEGNLNTINPNDVESITVLKDAAAASIWGTRAGNGVIVITTKKGRYGQPIKVEFNSNILFTQKPDLSYIKDISSTDYTALEQFLYGKGFYTSQLNAQPWLGVSPVVELLKQRDLGKITAAEAAAGIANISTHSLRDDMSRYVYQTGINTQQSVAVRGGGKNITWNLGAGWDRNDDVLDNLYQRFTFKSGQQFKISPHFEINTGIDYTQSYSTAGKTGYGSLRPATGSLPVYTQLSDDSGKAYPALFRYRQAYTDTSGAGKLLDWNWYPLTDYRNTDKTSTLSAVLANIGMTYSLPRGFAVVLKYQYGRQVTIDKTIYGSGAYYTRDLINSYTQLNRTTGQVTYKVPKGSILDNANTTLETQNIRGQITYNRALKNHTVEALAGAEYRQINSDYQAGRSYGYDPDILGYATVDLTTQYPNFLTGAQNLIPDGIGFSGTQNRYVSFYANAGYTYKGKYSLSASGRRDASNLFGASSNNKWTPLWSAGAAWAISKEKFYTLVWLPQLKFRVSYGCSGNADPLRSAVSVIQYAGSSAFTQLPIANIAQYSNPQLSWERIYMLNAGFDFALRSNRLSGSVDYYYKKGVHLFGTSLVDYTALSFNSIIKNVASIAGHGWDINLNSRNLTGVLNWNSQLNLNFNRDKVLQYYLVNKQGSSFVSGSSVSAVEGRPVYALYGYRWAGLDPLTGDPQGYLAGASSKNYASITGAGTLVTDLDYIGPTLPTVVASLGNSISYKGFSFSIRVTGKFGHYFQRPSIDYSALFNMRQGHTDYALRWQQPGDEATTQVPSLLYPVNTPRNNFYRSASVLATPADFIRLQYITLSYDVKRPALQVFVNVNNLGLLWRANDYGIDPEYNNNLPASMNFAFGIKANF